MPQERKNIRKGQKPKALEATEGESEPKVPGAGQGNGSGLGLHGMEQERITDWLTKQPNAKKAPSLKEETERNNFQ